MSPQSIAHYRIVSKLGEGGMGAVYRATDTKLNRDVAIKVLPESFAQDPDRLARFTREAQVLASLNHPNIATLYGVEDRALIMELVEGSTLAERIAQGAISLEDALPLARQVAEALEYAHDRAVVHRDLKPANVKVTPEGRVKVLDFGLAKALSADVMPSDPGSSPTLTMRATIAGVIMGTPGYMSPEQAKGKPIDRRADIWAFGALLAEMLSGKTLYSGETVSEILAAVIKDQPDLAALPAGTPASIRRLLKRCLEKDPQRRLQSIGEARIAIDDAGLEAPPLPPAIAAPRRGVPWWTLALAALPAIILGALLWSATRPVERPMQRFVAELGPDAVPGVHTTAIISPDGSRVVFPVRRADGVRMLATRTLDQSKATILAGTENAEDPFFSPDGQWLGFGADQKLKKVPLQGGAVVTLCEVVNLRGADWGADGKIIANLDNFHLAEVADAGGAPRILTNPAQRGERTHRWPQILPGGEAVLFTANISVGVTAYEDANIGALSLKTGQIKIVQHGGYFGRYIPDSPGAFTGRLVFVHEGTLFALPFDAARLEVKGTPLPVVEGIAGDPLAAGGQFSFSRTGTLVYLPGSSSQRIPLVWVDAAGTRQPLLESTLGRPLSPRFSPDGKRLAVSLDGDIHVYDLQRGALSRLTKEKGRLNSFPVWMPDGRYLVYAPAEGGIRWLRSDGSGQPQILYEAPGLLAVPSSISPDGRSLAITQSAARATNVEIWILPLDTADPEHPKAGKPELFVTNRGNNVDPAFSPDGRWMAYASNESGEYHVLVRPFGQGAKAGGQVQASTIPGRYPVWSRAASELFYVTLDGQIMSVSYALAAGAFNPGTPRRWSEVRIRTLLIVPPMDVAPDGKRIVASAPPEGLSTGDKANLHVVFLLNFFDELRRRVK